MDRPGISRAVTAGVVGFLVGALVVFVVRWLQSATPIWDPGVGLVFGTFFSAGFFIWGIGAFDPRLSAHGEAHEALHPATEIVAVTEAPAPMSIFRQSIWQLSFATILFIIALAVMVALGPRLITASDPEAAAEVVGTFTMMLGDNEIVVSQLTVFAIFIAFTLISLVVTAWIISLLVTYLAAGAAASKAGSSVVAEPVPLPRANVSWVPRPVLFIVSFVVLFAVLYLLFYYVLIGLVLPNPVELLTLLSLVNALVVTILILRPKWLIGLVAVLSKWLANLLRGGNLRGGRKVDGTTRIDRRNGP